MKNAKKVLRIGNAGGYWGDDPEALKRQVQGARLDYITIDFLAEITMSIMQKQYAKDPNSGYAHDFIPILLEVLPQLLEQKTRIITNAGGINPHACATAIAKAAAAIDLHPRIAIVSGDNILPSISSLSATTSFENLETGEPFAEIRDRLGAANIYFGAKPIVEALANWAPDLVITGRVTDTGISLACMIHEFGWQDDDWDKLASGIVAGHILECGTQATGGNFSDWEQIDEFTRMGFPIVELESDGNFVVTKHPHTGGKVSVDTVREQLFYEMGDPRAYLTPDVVADFSTLELEELGGDRVKVYGVCGYEPTALYKVSMAYEDGFKCVGGVMISGPNARAKAQCCAKIFWQRIDFPLDETNTEYVGINACHGSIQSNNEVSEVLLRLGARSHDRQLMNRFRKAISSLILSGPPGATMLSESMARVQGVVSYWPTLIPKDAVYPKISCLTDSEGEIAVKTTPIGDFQVHSAPDQVAYQASQGLDKLLAAGAGGTTLAELCLARSGDKGDTANIGIFARNPKIFGFLKEFLTAQLVKDLFQELCHGQVNRYVLPKLEGLNFLLEKSLGGGGSKSLRADAQGKTFAQALLSLPIKVPDTIAKPQ